MTPAPEPTRVVVLGSTGSIGRQAIEVAKAHPDRLEVVGLATGSDEATLRAQADDLGVRHTALGGDESAELATLDHADVVLNAVVGAAGLKASVAALDAGKTLALANKESLVAGGPVCRRALERGGGRIVPVDSEHVAIAQCLRGTSMDEVARVTLTASGGPFRETPDLDAVTPDQALQHPTWKMGPKITIDCATLMNKGLEVIEAHFLFDLDYERISVVVHPQSLVHGIVEFRDGSSVLQAAPPDMRLPIQSALLGEERIWSGLDAVDLSTAGALEFEPVDRERFPALDLAYEAGRRGDSFPAVLNAANEEAVNAFLAKSLPFTEITQVVEETLSSHTPTPIEDLEAVLEVDGWARDHARGLIEASARRGKRVVERVLGRAP